MNRLVMDYLLIEGYKDAAEHFATETGTPAHVDTSKIADRMQVRRLLQGGEIQRGIEAINDLNPELLDTNTRLMFRLRLQQLIELIRHGKVDEALLFAQDELASRAEDHPELLQELEQVMALLAFEPTVVSPVSDLLQPTQRQKTAGEVNAALLAAQGQTPEPRLPALLRLLEFTQQQLDTRLLYPHMDLTNGRLIVSDTPSTTATAATAAPSTASAAPASASSSTSTAVVSLLAALR